MKLTKNVIQDQRGGKSYIGDCNRHGTRLGPEQGRMVFGIRLPEFQPVHARFYSHLDLSVRTRGYCRKKDNQFKSFH